MRIFHTILVFAPEFEENSEEVMTFTIMLSDLNVYDTTKLSYRFALEEAKTHKFFLVSASFY